MITMPGTKNEQAEGFAFEPKGKMFLAPELAPKTEYPYKSSIGILGL